MVTYTALLPVVLALAIGAEATPANRQSWKTPSQRRGDRRALGAILPPVTVPLALAPAAPVPTTRVAGDFQTFNQGLGGVYAPAVTYANGFWYQSGQRYNSIYDALVGSCNAQADTCMVTGLVVDKLLCWGTQGFACTSNAQIAADAYAASSSRSASATSSTSKAASSTSTSVSTSTSAAPAYDTASASAYSYSTAAAAYSSSVAAYSASVSAAAVPSAQSMPDGWKTASTACIAEGQTGRALIGASSKSGDMTWARCLNYCATKKFAIAGIEYGSECYCGNVLSNGASLNKPSSQCNMVTAGAKLSGGSEQGGGSNALNLFVSTKGNLSPNLLSDWSGVVSVIPDGWKSVTSGPQICVKEGTSGRALAGVSTAADDMSIGKCISFCKSRGMQYAGLEYARECYCGNDLVNGASKDRTDTCTMQCVGEVGAICGGPALLTVYQDTTLAYSATSVNGFAKQGCIQEVQGRALTGSQMFSDSMTAEACTSYCKNGGFAFAGMEYAGECYCGNTLSNGASLSTYSTQCNMPCGGNSAQTCGGPNAISLWSTKTGNQLVGA